MDSTVLSPIESPSHSSRTGLEAHIAFCRCGRFAVLTERLKAAPTIFVALCNPCHVAGSSCAEVIPDSRAKGTVPVRLEAGTLLSIAPPPDKFVASAALPAVLANEA